MSDHAPAVERQWIVTDDHRLEFGSVHGARIDPLNPGSAPVPQPRSAPSPAHEAPPEPSGRQRELERARSAVRSGRPVELIGSPGSGRTTLLRHLVLSAIGDPEEEILHPDGAISLSARHRTADDLLQEIYRALHASDPPLRAGSERIESGLRDCAALLALDDVALVPRDVERLRSIAASCSFVMTTTESRLDSDPGETIQLGGLEPRASAELLDRVLEDPSTSDRSLPALELHDSLDGDPSRLLQAAGHAAVERIDLAEIARIVREDRLEERIAAALGTRERRVLALLVGLRPASLRADDVAGSLGVDDVEAELSSLVRRRLVRFETGRYGAGYGFTEGIAERIEGSAGDPVAHFADRWGEFRENPDTARAEEEVLRASFERALAEGRWREASRLGRALEAVPALEGRWDAWLFLIEGTLRASRESGDREVEAWALHERGSRALALGELEEARRDLARAVEIRESLGDEAGAAASRHNLSFAGDPVVHRTVTFSTSPDRSGPVWVALAVAIVLLGAIALLLSRVDGGDEPQPFAVVRFGAIPLDVAATTRRLEVVNRGPDPVRLAAARIEGVDGGVFEILDDDCEGRLLERGKRCAVRVGFRPRETGTASARLVVPVAEATSGIALLEGTGREEEIPAGTSDPMIVTEPVRLEFATRTIGSESGTRQLRIVNRGNEVRRVSVRLAVPSSREFFVVDDSCSNEPIPPGEGCTIGIRFRPERPGVREATLVVRTLGSNAIRRVVVVGEAAGAVEADRRPPP